MLLALRLLERPPQHRAVALALALPSALALALRLALTFALAFALTLAAPPAGFNKDFYVLARFGGVVSTDGEAVFM